MVPDDSLENNKISKIKHLLKLNPKGLTITEISKKLKISRISVARYLDILLVSGLVEMKAFGAAKAFFLSSRVPISAMLSFSSDFIVVLNSDLHILQINEKFCDFLGINQRDVVGQPISIEPLKFLDQLSPDPFKGGGMLDQEIVTEISLLNDDRQCFFDAKALPTVFDDGSMGLTIILHDITGRKLAEKSQAYLASIVENSNDAIISKDLKGNILSWNRAAEKMYGYSAEEILGCPISILIPENKKDELTRIFYTIQHGENVPRYETVRLKKNGELIKVYVTISPVRNSTGDIVAISAITQDLSQIKMMEDEIRIKGEKLDEIIEFFPDATIVLDRNNNILGWNRVLEEFTGIKKETIIGKRFAEVKAVYGSERPMLVELIDKSDDEITKYYPGAKRLGKSIVTEIFVEKVRGGKGIHLFIKATPLYDHTGNYIGAIEIFRDISDLKTIENSLKVTHKKVVDELEQEIKNLRAERDTLLKESRNHHPQIPHHP